MRESGSFCVNSGKRIQATIPTGAKAAILPVVGVAGRQIRGTIEMDQTGNCICEGEEA